MLIGSLMMAYNISREGSKLSAGKISSIFRLKQLFLGDYVLFSTYIIQLSVPLNFLGTVYSVLQRSFLNMENLFELFEEPSEDRDAGHIETITEAAPIEFRNVSFGYLPNIPILKNISFTVPAHKTVAIVGPSG
jgi:ABC-type transport system involved in Fe-S cluster assembly fused permease/ATPase subunit